MVRTHCLNNPSEHYSCISTFKLQIGYDSGIDTYTIYTRITTINCILGTKTWPFKTVTGHFF